MKFVIEIDLESPGMNSVKGVHDMVLELMGAMRGIGPSFLDLRRRFKETGREHAPFLMILQAGSEPDMQTDLSAKVYIANEDYDKTPSPPEAQWSVSVRKGENLREITISSFKDIDPDS